MELMNAILILNAINILLICGLLYIYVKNLVRVPSAFTWGLVLFALLFLVQNAVSFYYYITMMPIFAQGLETYVLLFNILQLLAFGAMNWVTWK